VALDFQPDDNVLVITSAGCNALDYALTGPNHVYAVDMNPRQNALLDLKIAAIRQLDYDQFFQLFGRGQIDNAKVLYREKLRDHLGPWSQKYWDRWIKLFRSKRRSFYFRGTSGTFARYMKIYTHRLIRLRPHLEALLEASTLDEQSEIWMTKVRQKLWSGMLRFAIKRDTTLSLLGVPKAQRRQIDTQYEGGVAKFVEDCMDAVFAQLPLQDNYFWRVYMTGQYSPECCPEYLREENFERLKNGAVDRISTHTDSVQGFLEKTDVKISKFVLLDHMDWMSDQLFDMLESEWQAILDRAADTTRIIWRSGGLRTDFIEKVQVTHKGQRLYLPQLLTFHEELARELHETDRVHTYGSFYIADVAA